MNCIKILSLLLLISAVWCQKGEKWAKGFADRSAAELMCGPRQIFVRNNRYYCYSISETILFEYEKQFGTGARIKINNHEDYQKLIDTIESNSFCQEEPNDLLLLLFPDDYEKYVAIGRVVQKFSGISSYCDKMAKLKGGIMTAHKLETKIQQLLNDGICEKVKKDAEEGSITRDSKRLQEIGRVLKKNEYCGNLEPLGKKICRKIFSAWFVCAIAKFFGADV
ncbi:uncharacterized protein LOC122499065 [Leptopilina heterotoma]|uniref:uncharacterized protein LOC122499065 n=1 Tax=Leptopilina heterotoma TaxID=63436 RepID=UPI001CA9E395|nr:uncharacterized protein LOC122499065 [Leptopilina heterotoma]